MESVAAYVQRPTHVLTVPQSRDNLAAAVPLWISYPLADARQRIGRGLLQHADYSVSAE